MLAQSISELATLGAHQTYPARTLLIREGEEGTSLFVLLEGRVRIFTENAEGERFVFGSFGPGTLFGETALDGGPRTASAETLTPCVCAIVPHAVICQRIASEPAFAMALVTELITRSRANTKRLKSLALESSYQRFRSLLERESELRDGQRRLGREWTQQAIASQIGSSRDMVTRIYRELLKGGYIAREGRETLLLKPLPLGW